MPPYDPAWEGRTAFYELLFGYWTSYALLVWIWQSWLKAPLAEWRYAMISFLGASAFWINHYFSGEAARPYPWLILINLYALMFFIAYWRLAIRRQPRSRGWKLVALLSGVVYTLGFIGFENLARYGVERWNMHELCWMTLSFFGFVWLIRWRAKAQPVPDFADPNALPVPKWRGAGGNM
ncbi:MAG: hypothetical protein RML32_02680 [Gammaproteobacteria bacterium]|nr:hypothetical protein [Gammaproteobacteria bacterium]